MEPTTSADPRDTVAYVALELAIRYGPDTSDNTTRRAESYKKFLTEQ